MIPLKEARHRKGLRREELATLAGVGIATIQRIELGQADPRRPVRLAIATALGMSIEDIAWTKEQQEQASE